MIAKYIGLVAWKISSILTGEKYCERVANLTREAVDELMEKAECKITVSDIDKDEELFKNCVKYSLYMRKRITLLRLKDMIY